MADINDILGINLPKEEPGGKRKIIENLIQDLVFSLGQGYSAGGRGAQGRSAGIGAALQGPMVRQQILQQQQNDAQAKQIEMAKFRELMRQGRNREAMELLQIRTQLPEETTMTPPPAPTEPVISGTPETGLTVGSLGTPTYAKTRPEMFTLPNGQQIPISPPSRGDITNQQYATDARALALDLAKQNQTIHNVGPGARLVQGGRVVGEGTTPALRPMSTPRGLFNLETQSIIPGTEPAPSATPPPTIRTKAGVMQWNPATKRYDIHAGDLPPTNSLMRDSVGYADLDPVKKAQVDAVAAKVAAGEYTVANGQSALGGVRGGLGGALTEALSDKLVLPTAIRTANSDIERAKNLLIPVHDLVKEINQTASFEEKVKKSLQLENYVQAIGTQFARAKGERGVVTDKDVSRVLGLIPGWKSANFAPKYAEDNLKLVEDAFARDQSVLLSKYFTTFQQGGAGATTPGATKPNTSGWRILNKP